MNQNQILYNHKLTGYKWIFGSMVFWGTAKSAKRWFFSPEYILSSRLCAHFKTMRRNKTTVLTFAEKCKVLPPSLLFYSNFKRDYSFFAMFHFIYAIADSLFNMQNILASNWQGSLNTIKADAKGRYHFCPFLQLTLTSLHSVKCSMPFSSFLLLW